MRLDHSSFAAGHSTSISATSAPSATSELRLRWSTLAQFFRGRAPGQLIIQYTDRCNAACPQCDMRMSADFARSTLPLDEARRAIDHAARNGVAALSITGGEPLLYLNEVTTLLRHASDAGILLTRTGTNGFLFANSRGAGFRTRVQRIAESLMRARLYTFWISIDSSDPETHEQMRGLPGVIEGIRRALPIFHEAGLYPSVNLGINRNVAGAECPRFASAEQTCAFFRDALRRFYEMAIDLGFTTASACYPMSVPDRSPDGLVPVYQATSRSSIVDFSPAERGAIYRALHDTVAEYRPRIRIFSPRASLLALIRQHTTGSDQASAPCRGGIDYYFVDARRGHAFPCGYRGGDDLGPYWDLDLKGRPPAATCRKCDWECWRDPSQLSETALLAVRSPWALIRRTIGDPLYARTWFEDLRYMAACDYFSGRVKPDYARLAKFDRSRPQLPARGIDPAHA